MKEKLILWSLKGFALLPLGCLYLVSDIISFFVYHVVRYRRKVVRQNLTEAFPARSLAEIVTIEREFYRYLGDQIVETLKLLHISPRQMQRRLRVVNPEIVDVTVKEGKSVVLLLGHYANWEWVQEIGSRFSAEAFKMSIYHPLKNRTWDRVFQSIRSRWHFHIVPQRQAVRTLLDKANRPWICGFIADNRPDSFTPDNVVPFLNHYTSFIYGPEVIGTKVGARFFFLEMERVKRGYYEIKFHPLHPAANGEPYPFMRAFWKKFEKVVERRPAFWLWSHKRWKRDRVIQPLQPMS